MLYTVLIDNVGKDVRVLRPFEYEADAPVFLDYYKSRYLESDIRIVDDDKLKALRIEFASSKVISAWLIEALNADDDYITKGVFTGTEKEAREYCRKWSELNSVHYMITPLNTLGKDTNPEHA